MNMTTLIIFLSLTLLQGIHFQNVGYRICSVFISCEVHEMVQCNTYLC